MNVKRLRKCMRNFGVLILLLFIFSYMTACGSQDILNNSVSDVPQSEAQEGEAVSIDEGVNTGEAIEAELSITQNVSDDTASGQNSDEGQRDEADTDREAMLNVYKSVLKGVYEDHVFPDGQACDLFENTDISQNQFAVYDIDQDGKDELILIYSTACMAGMVELIYDFDNNAKIANEEFREFPAITYYNNNIIQAEWSHNQGLSADFWPFTLYQYNSKSDSYDKVAMVDAWERSLSEIDYKGNPFPSERDTDGDGIVYYIMKDGGYELDNLVDGAKYEQWRDSYLNNANEVNIPFVNLTEDNINNIQ